MNEATPPWAAAPSPFAGSDWFDPLEEAVRGQLRAFIEQLLQEELEAALGRHAVLGASGVRSDHFIMRRVDGWLTLDRAPTDLDLAA